MYLKYICLLRSSYSQPRKAAQFNPFHLASNFTTDRPYTGYRREACDWHVDRAGGHLNYFQLLQQYLSIFRALMTLIRHTTFTEDAGLNLHLRLVQLVSGSSAALIYLYSDKLPAIGHALYTLYVPRTVYMLHMCPVQALYNELYKVRSN